MSPRLNRVWLLVPFLLLSYQAWSLGLGDIRLSSALNQPLRAEIELLAATPEELTNLTVQLASAETFQRYDLDRPMFLSEFEFELVRSGTADGNIIRITSARPVTEPFVTFLVEVSWSRGRLLREYTLLLDPPTFAPPPTTQSTEAVIAPTRAAPADSGRIERPAPAPQSAPPPAPVRPPVQSEPPLRQAEPRPEPTPEPAAREPAPTFEPEPSPADAPLGQPGFDATPGGDVQVVRGDTLWGITQRVRPDSRLTINQTMLAIFEANPEAFEGNINRLRAGATLRIPSAEDIFRIRRADAFAEVLRQEQEWRGAAPTVATTPPPVAPPVETAPSLTLVPPDEEDEPDLADTSIDTGVADAEADIEDDAVFDPEARIQEIEAILDDPSALIAIPDNELAALRQELADLRGEQAPVAEVDEPVVEEPVEEPEADTPPAVVQPTPRVVAQPPQDSLVDTILGLLNNFWVWIGGALIVTVGILVWFMRRAAGREDEDATGVWDRLDADEMEDAEMASTERLKALARDDESIVVVETRGPTRTPAPISAFDDDSDELDFSTADSAQKTMEIRAPQETEEPTAPSEADEPTFDPATATGTRKALDDTFSSETAINLDQSDPVAEADFHMAYGLYDQAADLINGALASDPEREDLLAKLCEIYFVWGNRDGFIDAAMKLKSVAGGGSNTEWDKIVIMGQQIAGDHEMFSGVSAEGVTRAVDLSFDGGMGDAGDLDIDFAGDGEDAGSDIIDLGADDEDEIIDLGSATRSHEVATDETGQVLIRPDSGSGIDFSFEDEDSDVEASATREMDRSGETSRTPTIEQQFDMEATGRMPAMPKPARRETPSLDATAEIDLHDLGLDIDDLEETAMADDLDDLTLGDIDDTAASEQFGEDDFDPTGRHAALDEDDVLSATSRNETIEITDDDTGVTGELPSLDEDEDQTTGVRRALSSDDATQLASLDDLDDLDDADEGAGIGLDTSLLDATGQTQILSDDFAVDTATNIGESDATMLSTTLADQRSPIADEAATLLASMDDDDDGDFDFAKTEALPKDVFSPDLSTDDTGRMPGLTGSTDMDLDLDDLTAALKVSEVGDTVNRLRDDATVEQPRLRAGSRSEDDDDDGGTHSLAPEDLSADLHEARTMTEVGTKLDLARAYVDMGDPAGARSILEEVLDEGDAGQRQQAQRILESLPS